MKMTFLASVFALLDVLWSSPEYCFSILLMSVPWLYAPAQQCALATHIGTHTGQGKEARSPLLVLARKGHKICVYFSLGIEEQI